MLVLPSIVGLHMCLSLPLETEAQAAIEYWRDLKILERGRSRSLKMAPIDRALYDFILV